MNLGSARATKVVGALALAAIVAGGWLLAVGPKTDEISEVRTQIEETKDKNVALQQRLTKLQVQQKQLPATRTTARALATLFPSTADQPTLFKIVTAAAGRAGIPASKVSELSATAPSAVIEGGSTTGTAAGTGQGTARLPGATSAGLAAQTVTITVQADYAEVQRLAVNLEEISRSYLITSLTLGMSATAGDYSATVTGLMFVMPAATDPAGAKGR